jgi:MFS family permease
VTNEQRILASSSIFHALNDSAMVAVPMVFPILLAAGGIIRSYSQIGLLSNFGLLATFLFQILVVHAAERWDYRAMLAVSFTAIALSLVLISFSSTYAMLFCAYVVFRIFDGFYHTVGLAWVSRSRTSAGIDFAMGVQSGSGNLGVFFAYLAVGYLAQKTNWRVPLQAGAAVCFCLGVVSFLLIRRVTFDAEHGRGGLDSGGWLRALRAIRSTIPGTVFAGASWSVTVFFAPSLLNRKFGVPMAQTGLFLALWIGGGTVMTYLYGGICRALGRERITRWALTVASISLAGVGLAHRPAVAVAGLAVFGSSLFLIYPSLQSCVGSAVSGRDQSQAFSVYSNIQLLSGALISLVSGYLSDRFGVNTPFLVMGGLGLVALALSAAPGGRPAPKSDHFVSCSSSS